MSTIFTSASSQFVLDHQHRRPSHSERRPSHADPARRPSHQDYLEHHLPPNHHRRHSQTQQHAAAPGSGGAQVGSGASGGQRRKSSSPHDSRHHKQEKHKGQQKVQTHCMSSSLKILFSFAVGVSKLWNEIVYWFFFILCPLYGAFQCTFQ